MRNMDEKRVKKRHASRIRSLEFAAEVAGFLPTRPRQAHAKRTSGRKPSSTKKYMNPERKAKERARRAQGRHAQKDALRVLGCLPQREVGPNEEPPQEMDLGRRVTCASAYSPQARLGRFFSSPARSRTPLPVSD